MTTDIKITGFTVGVIEIDTTDVALTDAITAERLSDEYDSHLSDMSETTAIVTDEGVVHFPYGESDGAHPIEAMMQMVKPLLDAMPTWVVEQYVTGRREDEE